MSEWLSDPVHTSATGSSLTITASAGLGFQIECEGWFASANNTFEWILRRGTTIIGAGFGVANTTIGALLTDKKIVSSRDESMSLQVRTPGSSSRLKSTLVFNRVSSR
jgi:hypothetical protein